MVKEGPERIRRALEVVYAVIALAVLVVGVPAALYADTKSLGEAVLKLIPAALAGMAPLVLVLLGRGRFRDFTLSKRWLAPVFAAAAVAGLWHGLGIEPAQPALLFAVLLPGMVVFLWAWLYRSANGLLAMLPVLLVTLALFLTEAPLWMKGRKPQYHWQTKDTFAFLFPEEPPYIGPGGRIRPDMNLRIWAPDYPLGARLITNAVGFRNRVEFRPRPEADEFRIMNLGDSFSIGFAADQDVFLGSLLEKRLRRASRGKRIRVINAETCDLPRAAYFFEKHGKDYRPRVVLYGLCGNDPEQSAAYCGRDKLFRVGGDGQVEPNPEFARRVGAFWPQRYGKTAYSRARTTTAPLPMGLPSPARKSYWYFGKPGVVRRVCEFSENLQRFLLFQKLAVARAEQEPSVMYTGAGEFEKIDGRKRLIDGYANLGFYHREPVPWVEEMYADFFRLLLAMHNSVTRAGGRFVLIIFPQRFQVQERDWRAMCEFWNLRREDFDLELRNRRLGDFCRENGILCCDLLEPFRRAAKTRPLYLPSGEMHFNTAGQRVAARATAKFLLAQNLLD